MCQIYFKGIFVHVIDDHIGNVINRRPHKKAPIVRVLISLIFKEMEWCFRKYMSTEIHGMVHQGLLGPQGLLLILPLAWNWKYC